ncbi:MAG: hypothetical protein C9356_08755 [Oleiphilus sp.]|nr:MAG: hypothetical protein C9356_08755 [Oleiphilus sp.]
MLKPRSSRLLITLIFSLSLYGCDPAFETTADLCANGQNSGVTIGLDTSSGEEFKVLASDESGAYPLYLQDILDAAEPDASETLTAEEQAALDSIKAMVNGPADNEFNLQYVQNSGEVIEASNPLDFLEFLMATKDKSLKVGAFEDARKQIQRGIAADDGFCVYSNPNIRFVDEDGSDLLFAELTLSYDPFSNIVQQSFLISELKSDLSKSTSRQSVPYFGFSQASPDEYNDDGYYPVILRQALMNSADGEHSLLIDDGNDNALGQIEITTQNTFCTDDEDNIVACDPAVTTRTPAKPQCDGTVTDEDYSEDQRDQVEVRSLSLSDSNDDLRDLKRIRLETDYEAQEVRIYVSKYNEAILDSDGVTEIHDPTDCEKRAVLDELADASSGGVRLTVLDDPGYDIIYDDDGNVTTTPIMTYTGTNLPSRSGE